MLLMQFTHRRRREQNSRTFNLKYAMKATFLFYVHIHSNSTNFELSPPLYIGQRRIHRSRHIFDPEIHIIGVTRFYKKYDNSKIISSTLTLQQLCLYLFHYLGYCKKQCVCLPKS